MECKGVRAMNVAIEKRLERGRKLKRGGGGKRMPEVVACKANQTRKPKTKARQKLGQPLCLIKRVS